MINQFGKFTVYYTQRFSAEENKVFYPTDRNSAFTALQQAKAFGILQVLLTEKEVSIIAEGDIEAFVMRPIQGGVSIKNFYGETIEVSSEILS